MDEPRDYLKELDRAIRTDPLSWMAGEPVPSGPLAELQNEDSRGELLRIVGIALKAGNGATRKTAAFCLGQIGDPTALALLDAAETRESAKGNLEAIGAARAVLNALPLSAGSTDPQRRLALERAYSGWPLGESGS